MKGSRAAELSRIEEQQCQEHASLKIQSVYRGKQARTEFSDKRKAMLYQKQKEHACCMIQSTYRGSVARAAVDEKKKEMRQRRELNAAVSIQSLYRGNVARTSTAETRQKLLLEWQQKKELNAAVSIQSLYRGNAARSSAAERRQKLIRELRQRRELNAAVSIQSLYRGKVARTSATELRQKLLLELQTQEVAAICIQCLYRSHAAKLEFRSKFKSRQENTERKRVNGAATSIQSIYRGSEARKQLKILREHRELELKLNETQRKYDTFLNLGCNRMCTTSWTSLKDRRHQETWASFFQVDGEQIQETNKEKLENLMPCS
jgi:hypothetical protein